MEGKELTTARVDMFDVAPGGGLMPRSFEALYKMSSIMAASGLMPKGMDSTEAVFVAVQMGLELGMSPMQAVQNIAPINGRPSIYGDSVLGLVRASGLLEYITETIEGDGEQMLARCVAKRKNEPEAIERTFTVADAKTAGLWGKQGPWSQYPKRMLQMRARSWALRDGFGDVIKGLQIAGHEAVDMMVSVGNEIWVKESDDPEPLEPDNAAEDPLKKPVYKMDQNEQLVADLLRKDARWLKHHIQNNREYLQTAKQQRPEIFQSLVDHWDTLFPGESFPSLSNKTVVKESEDSEPEPEPDKQDSSGNEHDDFRGAWINLKKSGYIKFVHDNLKSFEACKEQDPTLYKEAIDKWAGFYPNQAWPLLKQDETEKKRDQLRESASNIPDKDPDPADVQDQFNGDYSSSAENSMEDEQQSSRRNLKEWRIKEPDLFEHVAKWLGYSDPKTINIDTLDMVACDDMNERIAYAYQKEQQGPPA
jgi:hypothetical protein